MKKQRTDPTYTKQVTIKNNDEDYDTESIDSDTVFWAEYSDSVRKPDSKHNKHRIGPAPREEWYETKGKTKTKPTILGNLECDDIEIEKDVVNRPLSLNLCDASTHTKAIMNYFCRLATATEQRENLDYKFLYYLIINGAEVNVTDKFGQTVMHEVARNWNTDVLKFLIHFGGDVNQADHWGRTPLHLAAATNHAIMIDFLLKNGGDPKARTLGEKQTVMHYASKFNSVDSIKVLVEHKVDYNVRDYKGRTPIFLAAEMACEEAATYFLDIGVRVGVFDNTGMPAIGFMIQKMPHVAYEALNQFYNEDHAKRLGSYYLNYLEHCPIRWMERKLSRYDLGYGYEETVETPQEIRERLRTACPTTALEIAVKHAELNVIMHPAMQQLIKTKWDKFGKFGAVIGFFIHFTYVMIWTFLAIWLPRDGDYYSQKTRGLYWRLPLEVLNVVITVYFIIKEIISNRIIYSSTQRFFSWRRREINRDIQYCHPRWSQERIFLDAELDCLASNDSGILSDPWLLLEFPTYISVVILIVTRIAALKMDDQMGGVGVHNRAACFSLIFIWLHFLKSCRTFPALGIFITLLGYAIKETVNFAGIFFLFNLPYTIAFWIVFGGKIAKDDELYSDNINVGWTKLNDILYFSWQVTISVKFDDRTAMMDRIMAQIIAGTFYALSTVLCINVYIALLTETFNKVYYNAQAYAIQDQAKSILNMEKVLSQTGRQKIDDYIQENCGPLEVKLDVQDACMGEEKLWETVLRSILNRFGEFQDIISSYFRQIQEDEAIQKYMVEKEEYDLYQGLLVRDRDLRTLQDDIYELKCTVLKLIEPICTLPPKSKFPSLKLLDIKEPIEPSCLKKKRPKKSANQTKGKPIKKVKYRKKEGKKKNAANKKESVGGTTKTEKEQNDFNGSNANNSFNNNNNSGNNNNYNYNNNNNINNNDRFDNNFFFNNNNDNFNFDNDRNGVNFRNNIYVKRRDNNFRSPVPEYQRHSICYVPEDDPHSWCPTCGNKDSFYASAPKLYQENTLERGVEPPRSLIYLHQPSENINAEPIYASIPANQNQQKMASTPSRQSLRDIYDNSNQNLQTFTPEENQEYCAEIYDGNNLQNLPPATNVQCLGPIYETIPVKGSLHPIMANQFKNGRKNHDNQRINSNNTFDCPSDEFFIDKPVLSESIRVPQTSNQNIPHYDKVRPKSMPYFSSKDLFSQQYEEITNEPIPGSSRNTFKEDTNDRRHASEEMSPTNDILTTIDEQGSGDSLDIVEGNSSASSLEIVSLGSKGTTHRSSYHQDEFIDFDGVTVEPTLWTYPNKESYI